jgi:hypothetical protein
MSLPSRPAELTVSRLVPVLKRSLAVVLRQDKPLNKGLREVLRVIQDQAAVMPTRLNSRR